MAENKETSIGKQNRTGSYKNVFKMKCIFDERGESLEHVVEKAFGAYCNKRI